MCMYISRAKCVSVLNMCIHIVATLVTLHYNQIEATGLGSLCMSHIKIKVEDQWFPLKIAVCYIIYSYRHSIAHCICTCVL